MKRIPLYIYVAQNNPHGAASVIRKFGLPEPQKPSDLMRGLRYIMAARGEEGFVEIAKVHPDRKLILDVEEIEKPPIEEKSSCNGDTACKSCSEKKSNACGCSHSSFSGIETPKSEDKESLTKEEVSKEVKKALSETNLFVKHTLPYIAVIGVGVFLFTGILKK